MCVYLYIFTTGLVAIESGLDSVPCRTAQLATNNLYGLSGKDGACLQAFVQIATLRKCMQETCGKVVASCGGVDNIVYVDSVALIYFAFIFGGDRPLLAQFYNCYFTQMSNVLYLFLRVETSGEGACFTFIGKDDVHIVIDEVVEVGAFLAYHIKA